jgi:hypothetical protein
MLESFLAKREEAVFEAIVHRHGPMVLAVCRRVLGHVQDAEDAFSERQAARQLGWREGTLSGRLSRGQALLCRRLSRRGFTLSVAGLVAGVSAQAASVNVPAALAAATAKAAGFVAIKEAATAGAVSAQAALLAEGVIKTICASGDGVSPSHGGGQTGISQTRRRFQDGAAQPNGGTLPIGNAAPPVPVAEGGPADIRPQFAVLHAARTSRLEHFLSDE